MDPLTVYELGSGADRFRAMMVEPGLGDDEWRKLEAPESLAGEWSPPTIRFYQPGETGLSGDRRKKPLPTDTDMPIVFGALMIVVSERFVSLAGPLLRESGEFLPCVSADGTFFVYHCTRLVDALDEAKSEFSRSRSTGEILNVYKYAFRPEAVPRDGAFRLAKGHPYLTFVADSVDAAVRSLPLKGVRTERVWTSK